MFLLQAPEVRDLDVFTRQFLQVRADHVLIDGIPAQGAAFTGAMSVEEPRRT